MLMKNNTLAELTPVKDQDWKLLREPKGIGVEPDFALKSIMKMVGIFVTV